MSRYERFQRSARAIATKDLAQWLYVASACRLWLRESAVLRRRRRENQLRRNRVSNWDWTSSTAVMR